MACILLAISDWAKAKNNLATQLATTFTYHELVITISMEASLDLSELKLKRQLFS